MKRLFKRFIWLSLLLVVGLSSQFVGATSSTLYNENNIVIETSSIASDFGMDLMSSSDENYFKVNESSDSIYLELWVVDDIIYMYVYDDGSNSSREVKLLDIEENVLYNFGPPSTIHQEYYKIQLNQEAFIGLYSTSTGEIIDAYDTNPYNYYLISPSLGFVASFIAIISAWMVGIWTFVSTSLNSAIAVFWDGTDITILGVLALFGLAMTLVMFGLGYVRGLIKK